MSGFLRQLLSAPSAFESGLPYNWNWQRRCDELTGFLGDHPIILMDIAARGGPPPELASMRRCIQRFGFEPDPAECHRLNRETEGTFFPNLVGSSAGSQTLNLYRDLGYSSTLTLSERFQRLWSGVVPIDNTITVNAVSLDTFLDEYPEFAPDILKIDTQGSELSVLAGTSRALESVGLVEVEVEFTAIYDEQPLFPDVARFMNDRGFELLYLNRAFVSRRQVYQGPSRGQVLFADALFGKREDCLAAFTIEQLAKHTILLCQYGHLDIASQLFKENPELDDFIPGLRSVFALRESRLRRLLVMQFDKFLALLLHWRRYNHRSTDSDRAWPIP